MIRTQLDPPPKLVPFLKCPKATDQPLKSHPNTNTTRKAQYTRHAIIVDPELANGRENNPVWTQYAPQTGRHSEKIRRRLFASLYLSA